MFYFRSYVKNAFIPSRQVSQMGQNALIVPSYVDDDSRVTRLSAHALAALEALMRVDDRVRKTVVFLGAEINNRFVPYGTGVIGHVEYGGYTFDFIIGARHVIVDDIPGSKVSVRLNRMDGRASTIQIDKDKASYFTKDSDLASYDVAVLLTNLGRDIYDFVSIPLDMKYWHDAMTGLGRDSFGVGDEVSVVGLYTSHFGQVRNIPVVRIGHIAAVPAPTEKIRTDIGYVTGFLIEIHSIAGLSGSPVFLNIPEIRATDGRMTISKQKNYYPIGILIGHHVIETKEDEIIVPRFQEPPESHRRASSAAPPNPDEKRTGFGVVVPLEVICAITGSEPMKEIFKQAAERENKRKGFVPTSAIPSALAQEVPVQAEPAKGEPNPNHKEAFTSLLNAAAKKSQPAD